MLIPAYGDIARSRMDFRFRGKSGRAADITAMTEVDPSLPSVANFPACTTRLCLHDVVGRGPGTEGSTRGTPSSSRSSLALQLPCRVRPAGSRAIGLAKSCMRLVEETFVAEAHVNRRLAAILCADVAGYARLMGDDEERTLAALKAHRRELIDPLLTQHQGRIVKTTGDGILIEFASVIDAVRCAVVIQQGMQDRNASVAQSQRILFRIGINLGDIIIEDGDIS